MVGENNRWRDATPFLVFCAFCFAWGDVLFGIDTGSFGSIQALPSFLADFGVQQPDGSFKLPTQRTSIMNSIVWPGKLLGTMAFEPLLERVGYKKSVFICSCIQIVAIIIQMTAHEWIQFSIGRIIAYFAVGIIENAVPSYQAEIAPASLRGFFAGSIIAVVTLGNMWGSGMGKAMATNTTKAGWLVPVGVQVIPAVILLATIPFTVESPRWLLLHGKKALALKNLNKLRPKRLVEDGSTAAEIEAIDDAIEYEEAKEQGSWFDLFRTTYLRRTVISSMLFWFQQTSGSQFVNSYSPTFFKQMGLGSKSFTYSFVAQAAGMVSAFIVILCVDRLGRRPLLISGMFLACIFNFLIAGLGRKAEPTPAETNTVIASTILLIMSIKYSASTMSYLISAEIGGVRMRKKIIAFGTAIDVLSAFVVTFSVPYLLGKPGANLGANVGWIFGGDAVFGLIFSIFFVPELKGRSLEEVDELFEARLWAWQFDKYETTGIGSQIARLEDTHTARKKISPERKPED